MSSKHNSDGEILVIMELTTIQAFHFDIQYVYTSLLSNRFATSKTDTYKHSWCLRDHWISTGDDRCDTAIEDKRRLCVGGLF